MCNLTSLSPGTPAQPKPPTFSTSIVDRLLSLDMGAEPPSTFAKLENYQKFQTKSEKRILDDRPNRDKLIAPTPLLFQPFGYFRDIRCGMNVPGQGEIHDGKLRRKVDELADEMTLFHRSEEDRRSKFLAGLEVIFDVTPGTTNLNKIPGTEYFSDGHLNGDHGIMVFCLECENEVSTASCEPAVQLVAYVAASLRTRAKLHTELFNRWRVPILGVMHVGGFTLYLLSALPHWNTGPNVQFFGIVWVGKMRITPLTPLLPMVDPAGEGFRWDLFLAFKAARIVFVNIRTHIQHILGVLNDPHADRPPFLTTKTIRFPSITEIKTYPPTDTQPKTIKFILESRHDNIEHRELYHARLISPSSSDKAIYVKFSQRYSVELHKFCAGRGLAPRILGFQELHGGWFVVAMEKIDTVYCGSITSFPEAGKWKSEIEDLVHGFHQKGLVHGDLRLANFVFTSDQPRRMILIDFDWGGEDGKVVFPHEELIKDLGVSNSELYGREITKEHDRKCLEKVTEWLGSRIHVG